MKLLLIIALFVTVNGMAQVVSFKDLSDVIIVNDSINPYKTTVGKVTGINTSSFTSGTVVLDENNPGAIRSATFAEELLFLLQDYETECYNDSALVNVYIDPNTHTEVAPGVYESTAMMGYYEKQWQHKEPTFPEFIKWLKEK